MANRILLLYFNNHMTTPNTTGVFHNWTDCGLLQEVTVVLGTTHSFTHAWRESVGVILLPFSHKSEKKTSELYDLGG